MTNPENYDFYNDKIKEIDDIMSTEFEDENLDDFDTILNELGVNIDDIESEFNDYVPKLELG